MLVQVPRRLPPSTRRARGSQARRMLEEDEHLATRLAIEEIRALDIFHGDRALAVRLQEEEEREVAHNHFPLPRMDLGAEHEPVNIPSRSRSLALPTFLRNRPRLDLGRMSRSLNLLGAARRAFSRIRVASPSRHALVAVTVSPVIRIRDSLSHRSSRHECVTCMERIRGPSIRTPCGHYYDIECIRQLFDAATKDESIFPPGCCRRSIPLTSVWGHLSDRLQSTFEEKRREFSVQNRVYCAKPSCSRFLAAQQDRNHSLWDQPSRKCPAPGCGTITCLHCKNAVEPGSKHLCADSEVDRTAIKLARDVGWARCPGCATMVELNHGCYHMTCRCKTQFCYRCSARWKTCTCPQWEEPDLVVADPDEEPPPAVVPILNRRRRERPPPIRIPPPPPAGPRNPDQIRRNRSLPLVPDAPREREPRAALLREERTPSTASRQQRRAYRILPFPGDEGEEAPRRYIIVHERRPISGLPFVDEDPDMPVAGPSKIARASTNASSSSTVDSRTPRDSLELPSSQRLRTPGLRQSVVSTLQEG
ncbi:hypothetical protein LXA43DRAFT_1070170 [Ganoderma leucocontextum]|nr:hypothetical protein LXA43DRAFT_1070170 [Ganoderma leucocontextum]